MSEDERAEPKVALYWVYDEDGVLIYVGITNDPDERFRNHARYSTWWPLAARRNVQWLPPGAGTEPLAG